MKSFLKAGGFCLLCFTGWIVVIDLAAVLLVTLLPEPGGSRMNGQAGFGSKILYYVVWIVAGCFAGAIYSGAALDYIRLNQQLRKFPMIVFLLALVYSSLLIGLFYRLGEMQTPKFNYDYYVPGHAHMTYAFIVSFLVASLLNCLQVKKESRAI